MKILITIPHYYSPDDANHGSGRKNPTPRINALNECLFKLYSLFAKSQFMLQIINKTAIPANQISTNDIDVVICTANNKQILEHLNAPKTFFTQKTSNLEDPRMLGFECIKVLKENVREYDYYCYMEDDLIINDPLFFDKLKWFAEKTEQKCLLQPNRYEISSRCKVLKAYVDGDINPRATVNYQKVQDSTYLNSNFLGQNIVFRRPLNPHSGCFFLTREQMEYWTNQPYFLDMDTGFISPLESSASLGVMRAFKLYKPAPQNANFLEIQHYGDGFLSLIGNSVKIKV